MRVCVGRKLRVGPGDTVSIRARLPAAGQLGRLFIFASENGAEFSPYVPHAGDMPVANGRPAMLVPLGLRLVPAQPARQLSFVADIHGYIRVMQEVDTADDPRAHVRMVHTVNPNLGWLEWLQRRFAPWPMIRLTS